jgi:hypothetical protein
MKRLITFFVLLSGIAAAQIAPLSTLLTAGGFLEVCGSTEIAMSAAQAAAVKNASPSEMPQKLYQETDNRVAEVAMCYGYLEGIIEGWKEGHEHGVAAAQFPNGWPTDEKKALAALPVKQLDAVRAAVTVDVPCIPDYVTVGQEREIVVKYIQSMTKANFFMAEVHTPRVVYLAFQQAFPCHLTPDGAK